MNVLVTGARGFAGGHLANLLALSGETVTGWARPGTTGHQPDPFFDPSIAWADIDLLDRVQVARALAALRPDAVYHCAGAAHVGAAFTAVRDTFAANVLGTQNLIAGLRAAGLNIRVLITSSSLVYRASESALKEDDPLGPSTPYGVSKLAQEMLGLRATVEDGQSVVIARSFNHTGPRQDPAFAAPAFARQIALIELGRIGPEIAVGNLDAVRDLHDVRDTVRAYRTILERAPAGAVYNVCSGRGVSIRDVLNRLIGLSAIPVTVRIDPARYRPSDTPMLVGDAGKIGRDLEWTPRTSLDQTLGDLLDFWRKEVKKGIG